MSEFEPPLIPVPEKSSRRKENRINWNGFWLVLLSPAILASIGGALHPQLGFVGVLGLPAGAMCGRMLGRALGYTESTRALLTVTFAAVLMVTSTALATAGCLATMALNGL